MHYVETYWVSPAEKYKGILFRPSRMCFRHIVLDAGFRMFLELGVQGLRV